MADAQILLVEDDPRLSTELAEALRDAGLAVAQAQNGADAFARLARESFDLVVSDVMMPVMQGTELLAKVRQERPDLADMPFLFLTAYGSRDDQLRGLQLAPDEFVVKPCDPDVLVARIRAALARRQQVRALHAERLENALAMLRRLRSSYQALLHSIERDLRAPIDDIVALTAVLGTDLAEQLTADQAATLAQIKEAARRSASRVGELLALARAAPDQELPDCRPESLPVILRQALSLARSRLETRSIKVELGDLPPITTQADRQKLTQALSAIIAGMAAASEECDTLHLSAHRISAHQVEACLAAPALEGEPLRKLLEALQPELAAVATGSNQEPERFMLASAGAVLALHAADIALQQAPPGLCIRLPVGAAQPLGAPA